MTQEKFAYVYKNPLIENNVILFLSDLTTTTKWSDY